MQYGQPPVSYVGITAAVEFREEIGEIKYQYHRLAMQYDSINITARRSVTRAYAEERFYCAAILQFHSDANDLNRDNLQTLGTNPVQKRELPVDEDCPIARTWYKSLFESETLLENFIQAGHPAEQMEAIRTMLKHARQSLQQAHDWLRTILLVEHETENHSVQAVIEGWNVMVTDVTDAKLKPEIAAQNAAVYLRSRPNMPLERFNLPSRKTRYWSACELELPH